MTDLSALKREYWHRQRAWKLAQGRVQASWHGERDLGEELVNLDLATEGVVTDVLGGGSEWSVEEVEGRARECQSLLRAIPPGEGSSEFAGRVKETLWLLENAVAIKALLGTE